VQIWRKKCVFKNYLTYQVFDLTFEHGFQYLLVGWNTSQWVSFLWHCDHTSPSYTLIQVHWVSARRYQHGIPQYRYNTGTIQVQYSTIQVQYSTIQVQYRYTGFLQEDTNMEYLNTVQYRYNTGTIQVQYRYNTGTLGVCKMIPTWNISIQVQYRYNTGTIQVQYRYTGFLQNDTSMELKWE